MHLDSIDSQEQHSKSNGVKLDAVSKKLLFSPIVLRNKISQEFSVTMCEKIIDIENEAFSNLQQLIKRTSAFYGTRGTLTNILSPILPDTAFLMDDELKILNLVKDYKEKRKVFTHNVITTSSAYYFSIDILQFSQEICKSLAISESHHEAIAEQTAKQITELEKMFLTVHDLAPQKTKRRAL